MSAPQPAPQAGIVLPGTAFSLGQTQDAAGGAAVVLTISNTVGQAYIPLTMDGVAELIARLSDMHAAGASAGLVTPVNAGRLVVAK